ncbi:hAT dimerization domain-containing protein [Actinidia rufa]|uniref:HAT dimerization domain-containing protein n=1 Tax=Actinidia rufa TaxID=165716 RepID=A0A7J0FP54_9ERIC|nr:hAT dimerization domain-containing protein [Actinidia rufa]
MHMMPDFDEMDNELEDNEDDIVETDQRGKSIRSNQSSISFPSKVKKPKTKGPMDTFFTPNPDVVVQNRGKQTKIDANDPYKKELRDRAMTRFTRWMYDAGISFNAVNYPSFGPMIESIGQYGPGMKPPSYHETRVTYLKKELAHTNDLMKDHRENWVKYGCSIMADGWTDGKGRTFDKFSGELSKRKHVHRIAGPLIRVLRLVDTEKKSPMGYIYEAMDRAKETGYFLNPEFFYANPNVAQDDEIMTGMYSCISKLLGNEQVGHQVVNEIGVYSNISIAKKRNRLEQNRLNDLVFIKYNRALKRRYDIRDTIDPISLSNIDESNEWLCGRLDGESDEDEELVFEDDTLTWGAVARASGVGERSKQTRATTSRIRSKGSTSTSNTIHLMDEEEAGSEETEEDAEGYKSGDEDEDLDLLVVDVEDDF